jgi:hypothetical protein
MPDTPELQQHFGQPGAQAVGCGFPVAHLLCLFAAGTGLIRDVIVSPLRSSDLSTAPKVHPSMAPGDIVIGDTAFGTYVHLVLLQQQGIFGVFPNHQKRIVNFRAHRRYHRPGKNQEATGEPTSRWIKRLGRDDQLVEYFKPVERPKWLRPEEYDALPASLVVREIRRTIRRRGRPKQTVVVATTLLDPERYPADQVVELLKDRWGVETNLRHLKTSMKMDILHTQTVDGVHKELWMFLLIYNLVRVIMMEAAEIQDAPLDRISFVDALYWMRHVRPGDTLPKLLLNPYRPNRVEPRAIKRRPKQYDRLNKPRAVMRKMLKTRR